MRYIDKSKRCIEFDEYVNSDSPSVWHEFKTDIKLKLHQHLWREQQGLCIYCQQEVPEKTETEYSIRSHIEHIRPQKPYASLIFCYKNLSISCEGFDCNTGDTKKKEFCEHRKGNKYDEDKFLNPVECEDIEDYFIYDIEGKIHPNTKRSQEKTVEKSEYMIQILDLNHSNLISIRKKQYDLIIEQVNKPVNGLDIEDFLSPDYDLLPAFYSMLKQLFL
jgi:uncharacterized protein (TIGR02646 family)